MNRKLACSLCLAVFAVGWNASRASAGGVTIFTDLGPSGNVYGTGGHDVSGAGSSSHGISFTSADLFTALSSSLVSQIDLAVSNEQAPPTFYAGIWTDAGGTPGTQVAGAYWSPLTTSQSYPGCCGLVTITGISGVSLTGGESYFMVLGPLSISDDSFNVWNFNNQGVTGLHLYSNDGGSTWTGFTDTLGAFDILGTSAAVPEPGAAVLFASAGIIMVGLGLARRNS